MVGVPARTRDGDEHRAESRQIQLGPEILLRRVETIGPRRHQHQREDVADDVEQRPVAAAGQKYGAADHDRHISEERDLRVRIRRQEKRRHEAAANRQYRESLRRVAIRQQRSDHGHAHHEREGDGTIDQMVVIECGVGRHVENRHAAADHHLAIQRVPAAGKARARVDQRRAEEASLDHARGLADPLVVDGELLEVRDADHDRRNPDIQQPSSADAALERFRLRIADRRG